MKKNIFITVCSMFLLLLAPLTAEARDCKYGMPSPPIYLNGSWTFGQTLDYHATASSCLAQNISVTFDYGSWAPTIPFEIDAYLMESDQDPNPDDLAKTYLGRSLGNGTIVWSVTGRVDGNLDSAGDQKCELYMKFRVKEPLEPPSWNNYFAADMFRYTICVD